MGATCRSDECWYFWQGGSHPDSRPPTINAKPATLPWLPPRWRQTLMRVAGARRVHFVLICFWCWSSSARLKCSSCGVGALAVGPRTFGLGACAVPCAPPTSSQRETTKPFCPGAFGWIAPLFVRRMEHVSIHETCERRLDLHALDLFQSDSGLPIW